MKSLHSIKSYIDSVRNARKTESVSSDEESCA